jgi:hypothetical protein
MEEQEKKRRRTTAKGARDTRKGGHEERGEKEGRQGREKDWEKEEQERRKQDEERLLRIIRYLQRKARDKQRSSYTPWLLIRYALADLGMRPIPAGEKHWKSPDIRVESSDPFGNAVAGEANYVHARIFNLGLADAIPVQVDFYWANPALGLGPANMNHIGTEWVSIPQWTSREVRCSKPWIPEYVNEGHECLKVNCSNWVLDPIIQPFQPRLDRHAGQRNITVLEAGAGETISFTVELNNLFAVHSRMQISARLHTVALTASGQKLPFGEALNHIVAFADPRMNSPQEIEQRLRQGKLRSTTINNLVRMAGHVMQQQRTAHHVVERHGTSSIQAHLTDMSRILQPDAKGREMCAAYTSMDKLSASGRCAADTDEVELQELGMKAFEQRQLKVELTPPAGARVGEYVVADLVQRTNGLVTGGYTAVIRITGKKKL